MWNEGFAVSQARPVWLFTCKGRPRVITFLWISNSINAILNY